MSAVVLGLLAVGWGLFFWVVLPGNDHLPGGGAFSTGLAITAFTLGLRHGFDPDHIAAIDNVTRKLMTDGKQALTVGFWFALGHSSVVVITVLLLSAGFQAFARELVTNDAGFASIAEIWGVLISGTFLLIIGGINLVSLTELWRIFRKMRKGCTPAPTHIDATLARRGLLARILAPVSRRVDRPIKMYGIGVLFGLGFDTATTIALFAIGGAATLTAPWYVVLVLPILFTAGITLIDMANGVLMHHAYSWAYAAPMRRIYYNLIITLISVIVAFLIGGAGLAALLARLLGADGGILGWFARLEFEYLGYATVAILVLIWLGCRAYWKLARLDEHGLDGLPLKE